VVVIIINKLAACYRLHFIFHFISPGVGQRTKWRNC